ncbi:MAG: ceramidase [bacterium]|nr:ceramidase [bacterium]
MGAEARVQETQGPNLKLSGLPLWVHGIALGALVALTLALVVVFLAYRDVNVWEGWRESGGLRNPSYTEAIYEHSVFRTRANTWSNLAYVFVGLYAIAVAVYDRRRAWPEGSGYVVRTPAMSILFGVACCYLGFGSGIFHASLTRWGQQLDVASMYAPGLALIAIGVGALCPRIPAKGWPTWPALAVLAIGIDTVLYIYKWSMSSKTVLTTVILTLLAVGGLHAARRARRLAVRWYVLSFVALLAAWFFRQIDVAGRFTGPDAWLQGHVLWHFLTAASLGMSYVYFRSESEG